MVRPKRSTRPAQAPPAQIIDQSILRAWIRGVVLIAAATGVAVTAAVCFFVFGNPSRGIDATTGRVWLVLGRNGAIYVNAFGATAVAAFLIAWLSIGVVWAFNIHVSRRKWAAIKLGLAQASASLDDPRRRWARGVLWLLKVRSNVVQWFAAPRD